MRTRKDKTLLAQIERSHLPYPRIDRSQPLPMPSDQIIDPEAVGGSAVSDDRLVKIKQQISLYYLHHGRIFDALSIAQDQAIRPWLTLRC